LTAEAVQSESTEFINCCQNPHADKTLSRDFYSTEKRLTRVGVTARPRVTRRCIPVYWGIGASECIAGGGCH